LIVENNRLSVIDVCLRSVIKFIKNLFKYLKMILEALCAIVNGICCTTQRSENSSECIKVEKTHNANAKVHKGIT